MDPITNENRSNPEGYPVHQQNYPQQDVSNQYSQQYMPVQAQIIPSYPYNPSYSVPMGQPIQPRRIMIIPQVNGYGFDPQSHLTAVENEIQYYKGTVLTWTFILAILNVLGFIITLWAEVYVSNIPPYNFTYNPSDQHSIEAILGVLIGVTFLETLSMFFGYRALKTENITQLNIFLMFCVIWIAFDIILLITSFGGFFFLLLVPLFATLYIIFRGRRLKILFMEKQVTLVQIASQPVQ